MNTGLIRCSRHFSATSASVNFEPTTGISATQLEQERYRADVVLVRMGQHQCLHLVEAVLDVAQIGQDQVDAGLVVAREQHPAVDDQESAEMLENRHVAADFADAAQRGHPQTPRGQRPRRFEVCVHYRSTAAARISAASASICSAVAGT